MKNNNLLLFTICLYCLVTFSQCNKDSLRPEYVPGEIVVGFVDSATYSDVVDFFNLKKLEIKKLYMGHGFWARVDSNDLVYYRKLFEYDYTVKYVNQISVPEEDTLRIVIMFDGQNSTETDLKKIEKYETINIYYSFREPKWAIIGCQIGTERYWIGQLQKYDFIKYAEVNSIAYNAFE